MASIDIERVYYKDKLLMKVHQKRVLHSKCVSNVRKIYSSNLHTDKRHAEETNYFTYFIKLIMNITQPIIHITYLTEF